MSELRVLLASGSRYRKALLERLLPAFETWSPELDESPLAGESAAALAGRLARDKAATAAADRSGWLVIGSDQVASLDGEFLGKPGSREAALAQLQTCSGRRVDFHTAVCVILPGGGEETHVDLSSVYFRELSGDELKRYLAREPALDSAGSFKSEGLGIALMRRIHSDDPTALQGLPLIWLADCLRRAGIPLP